MISNALTRRPRYWNLSGKILASLPPRLAVSIVELSADFGVSCRVIRNAISRLALEVSLHLDTGMIRLAPESRDKAERLALEYWQKTHERGNDGL